MQLLINEVAIPEKITFNYEELKKELLEKVQTYETLVYTEDQLREAKADVANLRKLKTALNDERIRREREYMKPFNEFKAQINEIIGIIDRPIALIDKQVKEYIEQKKQEKSEQIYEYMRGCGLMLLDIDPELIFNQKWLNASCTMKMVQAEIDERVKQIDSEMAVLDGLDEFKFEATLKYKQTLNLREAIEEANRLKKIKAMKEEAEKAAQIAPKGTSEGEIPIQVESLADELYTDEDEKPGMWISFKAYLTVAQATELKEFFKRRGIDYKAI